MLLPAWVNSRVTPLKSGCVNFSRLLQYVFFTHLDLKISLLCITTICFQHCNCFVTNVVTSNTVSWPFNYMVQWLTNFYAFIYFIVVLWNMNFVCFPTVVDSISFKQFITSIWSDVSCKLQCTYLQCFGSMLLLATFDFIQY